MTVPAAADRRSRRRRMIARLARRERSPRASRVGYRVLLRNRDYRLLCSGLAISMTGSWAYNVALVVFVFDATHSAGWVAAASLSRFLTSLVASPFGGLLADRVERVRLMVGLDLLCLGLQALLAVVAAVDGPVAVALVLVAFSSVASRVYDPAARAATPAVVGEEHLAAANSLQSVVENLSLVLGPAIGAVLLLLGPPAVVFALNAASFGVSAVLVGRIAARSRPGDITEGGAAGPLRQMATGIRAFAGSPTVMLLAGFSILASFVYGTDTVLFVVVSRDLLGTGSTGYGYLIGALGVGGIVMAAFMNRVAAARDLGTIIVIGIAVYCLPTALLPLVHAPAVAAVLEAVRGAGTIVVDVLAITALQRMVSPETVARVFGVFFALVLGAISLGALLMPILLGALGLDATLLVMGLAIPALAVIAYPRIRALDLQAHARLDELEPRLAILQGFEVFAGATRGALESLARAAVEENVEAGSTIVAEDAEADDFFVLTDGEAEVMARGESETVRHLATLRAPDYFGEIGLLVRRPRTATVRAATPCTLLRITGTEFLTALTSATPTPGALGLAQARLARTHPSARLTFAAGADREG
ncbi:MAG: MFS transporter [Candidatus Dormibacteria bacterium]